MKEIIDAIIIGIVQGLAEFLPISSSGHIEIAKKILNLDLSKEDDVLFTIVLHFATALSTLIIFRKDIFEIIQGILRREKESIDFAVKIIISMIPAAFIGFFCKDFIEQYFTDNLLLVGCMLLVTAFLLFMADNAKTTQKSVNYGDAFLMGISQAIALLPGISRSGATISTSVLLGVDREKSARFSFLMVVPLIFGAMAKEFMDGEITLQDDNTYLIAGFLAAFISGLFACKWMLSLVKQAQLKYFSYYCIVVGLIAIGYSVNTYLNTGNFF